MIFGVCNKIYGVKDYNQATIALQISQTNNEAVTQLLKHNRNFKYMVITTAMQKKGGDCLEMTADCYWNASTDGQTVVRWENDYMHVFVTLFACAL